MLPSGWFMRFTLVLFLGLVICLSGCKREELAVREQKAPKQQFAPMMSAAAIPRTSATAGDIIWKTPAGWKELPGSQMRIASFQVSPENPDIQLTVIPLSGESGGLLANINRWEGQIGLPATAETDLPKLVTRAEVDGHPVDLVDMLGPESASPRLRLLGAVMPHGEKTYYFKLSGRADVVGSQKEKFGAFIQSVRFTRHDHELMVDAAAPTAPQTAAPSQGPAELTYSAPKDWIKDEPLPLRVVSFHVGEGEKRTDIIITRMPATGSGSYIANINRWRGQVGLPASNQDDPQPVKPLIFAGVDGMLFDYTGPGEPGKIKRMLLAWAPRGEEWWFFKMLGPAEMVAQQESAFNEFMKSVQFESKP
jgi:hypothetical protein